MSPEQWQEHVDKALDDVRHEVACMVEQMQGAEVVRDLLLQQIAMLKDIIETQRDELREFEARRPLRARSWIRKFR